jgi:hypothetical protein
MLNVYSLSGEVYLLSTDNFLSFSVHQSKIVAIHVAGKVMKQRPLILLVLLGIQSAVIAEVPTSIFDDDWKPYAPQQAQPQPRVAPTPSPVSPATTAPTPVTPAPTSTPLPPDSAVAPSPKPVVPPAPVVARLAVPTAAAQADSWKLIKSDLYKDDIANAKTPAQKVELAGKLLAVAQDTNRDPVGKYVLLAQAKELAISSGDPPTAFKCLDELGETYDINYPVMKLELFAALAKTVTTPADCQTLVDGLNRWADAQVKNDRYDAAKRACDIAQAAARTKKDKALIDQTLSHQKQISEIEAGYIRSKPSMLTLASKPADPAANLAAGRFYCFIKGDWDKGLPILALGTDAALKALAAKDLAGVSGADAQVVLGDSWWDVGEKETGLERDRVREHATDWYDQALPSLEGLAKVKVEKRLKEVATLPGHGPRVVNLLNLVDVQRDGVYGTWTIANGAIRSDGHAFCRIEFPYLPPEEYDFRIVFTRMEGADSINQICTSRGHQFQWVIGPWNSTIAGFEDVGGKGAGQNPTTKKDTKWLTNGQEYVSVVKVRTTGVEAYINGKLISAWKTDYSDMKLYKDWGLQRSDILGVGSWQSPTVFRTVEVIEVTGRGKTLAEGEVGNK